MVANLLRLAVLVIALLAQSVKSHEEKFDYEVTQYSRTGKASLRIYENVDHQKTVYEFTTKQIGVYQKTGFRVAFQWLRNMKDNSSAEYESVVFQFRLPLSGQHDDYALQLAQGGLNYNQFNNLYGGGLDLNDYVKAVLFNKTGFVKPANYERFFVTTQQVSKYFSNVEVKLTFELPNVEEIGEHRIWYRWAFYNPYTGINTCKYDVDCLGPATIDGQDDPYFWSKYSKLTDYIEQDAVDWTVTLYWIMTGISLFNVIGWPFQVILRLYTQWFILDKSIRSYQDFLDNHYDPAAEGNFIQYLVVYNLWHTLFLTLMNLFSTVPILGSLANLLTTLGVWTYTDVESQQVDYNNYYGIQKFV